MSDGETTNEGNEATQLDPVEIPDSWWLIRGSNGKGSVSTTLLVVAFFLTAASYALNMFNVPWVKPFDVAATASFLTPLVALYFGRRHSEASQK